MFQSYNIYIFHRSTPYKLQYYRITITETDKKRHTKIIIYMRVCLCVQFLLYIYVYIYADLGKLKTKCIFQSFTPANGCRHWKGAPLTHACVQITTHIKINKLFYYEMKWNGKKIKFEKKKSRKRLLGRNPRIYTQACPIPFPSPPPLHLKADFPLVIYIIWTVHGNCSQIQESLSQHYNKTT